ncbi:MAG: archease [Bdellovibrio sp.]
MDQNTKSWEHFAHGADIGVRGLGENIEEAFEMGARALTALVTEIKEVEATETLQIHCQAPNLEILFFDWINALIYEMDTRHMVFNSFNIHIKENELNATVTGELLDPKKHPTTVEPKGGTMTELKVLNKDNKWIAQCIVDV